MRRERGRRARSRLRSQAKVGDPTPRARSLALLGERAHLHAATTTTLNSAVISQHSPLHDGAQRLAEAALLVAAGGVGHIHGKLGLHRDVVLQRHVSDLVWEWCVCQSSAPQRRKPSLASSRARAAQTHLDIVEAPLAEQLHVGLVLARHLGRPVTGGRSQLGQEGRRGERVAGARAVCSTSQKWWAAAGKNVVPSFAQHWTVSLFALSRGRKTASTRL